MTRLTINLRAAAVRALDRVAPLVGGRTAAIDRALRLQAELHGLADADGAVTVLGPGRARTRVVVL